MYFNADSSDSGATAEAPNFDLLEEAFGDTTIDTLTESNNVDTTDTTNDVPEFGTDTNVDSKPNDNTDSSNDKKEDTKNDVNQDDDLTFKLPGEEGYIDPLQEKTIEADTIEETTWLAMAEAQGLKIEEDSVDAYLEAVKQDKEISIQKAVEEVQKQQFIMDIAKFPETERLYMEHVINGGTFESFQNPTGVIDSYLQLDNYELLAADLQARGFTDKMIDTELALMMKQEIVLNENTANEQVISMLDHNADKLRQGLELKRQEVIQQVVEDRKQIKEREEQIRQEKVRQENETFKEELGRTETFFDIPVTKQQKDFIKQKWESGELRQLFAENPKIAVKAAMQHYFGDQALKMLKTMEYDAGMDRFRRKLANVPPKANGSSGRTNNMNAGGDGPNFDLLQQDLED